MTTYKEAGVDIDVANEGLKRIKKHVSSTFNEHTLSDIGSFGGCFNLPIKDYLTSKKIEIESHDALIEHHEVIELFDDELKNAMTDFSKFEQIKKFKLISRPFIIEKGEMTPKMSIVRKVVEQNFNDEIEEMYKGANL